MVFVEIEWGVVDWIGWAEDRDKWRALLNFVMKLRVLLSTRKLSSGYTTGSLSSSAHLHRERD
jgi:hypothetical protein